MSAPTTSIPPRVPQDRRAGHRRARHRLPRAWRQAVRRGRERAPAGAVRAQRLPAHRHRRQRHRAARALRDGPGHLDRAADAGRRGARRRLVEVRVEHAPAAPAYAHTALRHADDRRLDAAPGRSSTATARPARWRARCWCRPPPALRRAEPSACRTENGVVIAGSKRARYGELAEAAGEAAGAEDVTLKDPKDWKLIGKPTKRLDTPEKITGRAEFGIDVQFPGLLTAVVARPPVFGGKVKSFDATKAQGGARRARRSCRSRPASRWSPTTSGPPSSAATRSRSSGTWARRERSTATRCARSSASSPARPGTIAAQAGDVDRRRLR